MHIVLVDGSRTGLMIIRRLLEPRGDSVADFTDGQDALDYIRAEPAADLLMTSFEIDGISGTELCWEARLIADSGRPLYVIAMSSSTDEQHSIGVLDAGADDFMSKPPNLGELNARLRVAERTLNMQRRLIEMATKDPLSNLFNRRAFREKFEDAIRERATVDGVLSLILLDLDHFKRINDLYGHEAGDEVIRLIGSIQTPPDTIFARTGGEEFALILPDVDLEGARSVAEYMRNQIAALKIKRSDGTIQFTASFGVSELRSGDTDSNLYRRADSALYHSKNRGRNRVCAMTDTNIMY